MLGFLRKKTGIAATVVAPAEFIRGYTAYGFAGHILKNEDSNWVSLCGREIVKKGAPQTPEEVAESLPRQHETSFYCVSCAVEFTGATKAEVQAWRN